MGLNELIQDSDQKNNKKKPQTQIDENPKKPRGGKFKKGENMVYAPKKTKKKIEVTEKKENMNGMPSLSFIRKIYNILNHKQEQLDEITRNEKLVDETYNGDFALAYK